MSEINLTNRQIDALKAVDEQELSRLIDDAVQQERLGLSLSRLPLSDCGVYVGTHVRFFEDSLKRYREAKSAKKRAQTESDALRAGSDLLFAFQQMKRRMETEEGNRRLFFVDDHIIWPSHFTKDLSVTVAYRFRKATTDQWTSGRITFHYQFVPAVRFSTAQPNRRKSAAKQAEILQNDLSSAWQHLMKSALYTVRNYFLDGGDGNNIPDSFRAITDNNGQLDNFSLRFWLIGKGNRRE